jgi:hypothetical protein
LRSESDVADRGHCSGVVVAQGYVLTAGHCAAIAEPLGEILVELPAPQPSHRTRVDASGWFIHPELDVALVQVEPASSALRALRPIPPNRRPLDAAWLGSPVELAGYGASDEGALSFAVEPISEVTEQRLKVDGEGRHGACSGDSGGPLLGRSADGSLRVLGVLDQGSVSCTGVDWYTRLDVLADWEPFAQAIRSLDEPAAPPCDGVGNEGSCLRDGALWCEDGALKFDACEPPARCGYSLDDQGFRCVDEADDACEGIGSFRTCDDGEVVSCEGGEVLRVACGACQSCVPWQDGHGAGCQ